MAGKAHVWMAGLLALVVAGCYEPKWADINQAMTRHKLRGLEKRFEQFNGTYQIGMPDVLTINVPDHPDLSGTYEVRPDGNITFQLLGDVYAEGLTPMQLSEVLVKRLSQFIKQPEAYVTISAARSKYVYIFDRTRQAGVRMPYTGDLTALDIVAEYGGWNRQVRAGKIRLIRDNPEKPEDATIYRVQGDKMVRGDLTSNVMVRDKDMLYMPANIGAEISYVVDVMFMPFRSIVMGVGELGRTPYAIASGYLEYERERQWAQED